MMITWEDPPAMATRPGVRPTHSTPTIHAATPNEPASVSTPCPPAPANNLPTPRAHASVLADPILEMASAILDDLEAVRIANENRLRQLTRTETDADGEDRGFGMPDTDPDVIQLTSLVGMLSTAEQASIKHLEKIMRRNPLGPWIKAQPGIGDKQAARLLAAIGDPYMRPEIERTDGTVEPARPRTVSELWAYSGYHVKNLPDGQADRDTQTETAAGDPNHRHVDQRHGDNHIPSVGVAVHHQRGQVSNWNDAARMRAHLIAVSCVKQPRGTRWRDVYDDGRMKYADAVHWAPCKRCGPAGKPAPVGSPLSAGHQHARALRLIAKTILKELWREAGRLHGDDTSPPPNGGRVDHKYADAQSVCVDATASTP